MSSQDRTDSMIPLKSLLTRFNSFKTVDPVGLSCSIVRSMGLLLGPLPIWNPQTSHLFEEQTIPSLRPPQFTSIDPFPAIHMFNNRSPILPLSFQLCFLEGCRVDIFDSRSYLQSTFSVFLYFGSSHWHSLFT